MSDQFTFTALPARVDLPAIDHEVLAFWRDHDVFQRSLAHTARGPRWVFYEGPPTANGRPGTHHVEARVFKDVFPRFKTMKGYHVPRRAGWDCHGLPVEIAVERELGLTGKHDIERIGIAEFNARCRESVQRYVGEFEELTERVGYWVDLRTPYWTMSPEYIDSVWWALRQIFDKGLLVEDHRVAPYCPRCGTALSDHEVAQGYEIVKDPSVYLRMPVDGEVAGIAGVDLLVWTTTPWTLVSNTAVAVHPGVTYVVARVRESVFVVAEPLLTAVLGEEVEVLATIQGRNLEGLRYRRPLDLVDIPDAHYVVLADYVTTEDGTGLVHLAPAFGADDLVTCRRYGLPVVNPIEPNGRFKADVKLIGGLFFKEADPVLVLELQKRGVLLWVSDYKHSYPHCWRCHTPLMYYAQLVWYIRTTQIRDALLRENEHTNWHPEHIKHGRYGDWLANNVDWALSRNRYWGTPLPLWRCTEGHVTCVESREELGSLAGQDLSNLDPHRPYIDEISFDCGQCGAPSTRVSEVIDAWFDSGSMPFAQHGFPFAGGDQRGNRAGGDQRGNRAGGDQRGNRAGGDQRGNGVPGSDTAFAEAYPAQFIAEAIDQTRGWFYTLMAVGTLVFGRSAYESVLCLGHIVAEDGRKMSKHLGNVIEPMPLMDRHGADALRWFMLCAGSPWLNRRVGDAPLEEIVRRVLVPYWNSVSFFTLYADANTWHPSDQEKGELTPLDRWLRAELHNLIGVVDSALEDFDTAGAGRALGDFIDDLSNWYIRLSRARFWQGDPGALATLYETIGTLTRLLAPLIPFLAEHVWRAAVRPGDPSAAASVHLATWPAQDATALNDELRAQMATVRALVEAGRAARKASNLRVRQPLARALIGVPDGRMPPRELLTFVSEELNVRGLASLASAGEVVDVSVKPNFRRLGQRFGPRTQQVAAAIGKLDPVVLAAGVQDGAVVTLDPDPDPDLGGFGDPVEITAGDVIITQAPRSGWSVATQRGVTIALDTTMTPQLRRAGLAREAIRLIQEARKRAGLAITDRIEVVWIAAPETVAAIREYEAEIAEAVLATRMIEAEPDEQEATNMDDELGLRFSLRRTHQ